MTTDTSRLSIEISKKLHKKLKILAELNGLTLRELILASLEPILYPNKAPNATTQKIMKDTDQGKNLIPYKNMKTFWKKLGLDE